MDSLSLMMAWKVRCDSTDSMPLADLGASHFALLVGSNGAGTSRFRLRVALVDAGHCVVELLDRSRASSIMEP
jgi:hypothetical protein